MANSYVISNFQHNKKLDTFHYQVSLVFSSRKRADIEFEKLEKSLRKCGLDLRERISIGQYPIIRQMFCENDDIEMFFNLSEHETNQGYADVPIFGKNFK
jgi:hypothetical protein